MSCCKLIRGNGRESGTALTELAVVIPVLLLLVLAVIQYGLILNAKVSLQNVAEQAARQVTIFGDGGITDDPTLQAFVTQMLPNNLPASGLDTTDTKLSTVTFGTVNATRVEVAYNFDVIIPLVVPGASGGQIALQADAIMR